MQRYFWVKLRDCPPERWRADSFDEFWHRLRNALIAPRGQKSYELEWIIVD